MDRKIEVVLGVSLVAMLVAATVFIIMSNSGSKVEVTTPSIRQPAHLSPFDLKDFLVNHYEKAASQMCTKLANATWEYNTDTTNKQKSENYLKVQLENAEFTKTYWSKFFKNVNLDDLMDEGLKRQLRYLKEIGTEGLEEKKFKELESVKNDMVEIYTHGRICPYKKQKCDLSKEGLSLTPEITNIFSNSTDYDELLYVWKAWRDIFDSKVRKMFRRYVDLSNEAAVVNNVKDYSEMLLSDYESPTFIEDVDKLWSQVEPLYTELHKYAGRKLKQFYGDKLDISDGLIPAHVFGNMWAQDWDYLDDLLRPFPNAAKFDGDQALIDEKYTVLDMFKVSDEFYKSMGLIPNDICYNTSAGAIIEKPTDGRQIVCHPSAWDFCDKKNYRIKMCTQINFQDFIVIHHEMGHIQYDLQYADELITFRTGANPGFHEAIGDTIALSVTTPKHLKKIGLLKNYTPSNESSLNALMDAALGKVAFLPFGLLIDKWRWDVFSGKVSENEWNAHWWKYRKQYQKLKPPMERPESNLDPVAKFHVAADAAYVAYFVSHILQFQFYKSLCIAAGQYNPDSKNNHLFECDFFESKEAGKLFSKGLGLGASRHWSDTLEIMTGSRKMDASAVLEYFEPLYQYLKEENSKAA